MNHRASCLSTWFDRLKATGVPVPPTTIIRSPGPLHAFFDGKDPECLPELVAKINEAADPYGYPFFLRTGQGSGKHDWKSTCLVPSADAIADHVHALVEWSEMVDMLGLPHDVWVVRPLLPLVTAFEAFSGRMPVNVERRYFIRDGRVQCRHPYWPEFAIDGHNPSVEHWRRELDWMNAETPSEVELLTAQSLRVAAAIEGAWSLDWALAKDGTWYAIDMAVADESFHWPGCPHGPKDRDEHGHRPVDFGALLASLGAPNQT